MNLWQDKLTYSQSKMRSDISIIKDFFPKCVDVAKAKVELDKLGIDYIAKLLGGVEIFVDVKTREKGASRYWKYGEPELALEVYSVVESKKLGWTLSDQSKAHYILYTFDPADSKNFFMVPFQLLRKAFMQNGRAWVEEYGLKQQASDSWHSSAVFVPAGVVLDTIKILCEGNS